jgi:transposase
MMGQRRHEQEQLFYSFRLADAVPEDHPVRGIAAVLDLSWVYAELASYYPRIGRPSIDPVLMIRMLIVGYVFAIRSERALCREVQVNLAYRWFCGLSIEDKVPDHSAFSRARNERFGDSAILVVIVNATANKQYCTGHPYSWSCDNPIAPGPDLPDEMAAQSSTSLIVGTFTLHV